MNDTKWYVVKTVANKEKQCKEQIDSEIRNNGFDNMVKQVVIPMERVYHIRKGKKIATERNHYPGYVLIETNPNILGELKTLFKNINFVSGFLGDDKPESLRKSEIERILGKMDELANADEELIEKYIVGELVKIVDGPFNNFTGKVMEVYEEKRKLKLNVKIFGRETPLELNFTQITKDV